MRHGGRRGPRAPAAASALERIRSEAAFLHEYVRPMVLRLDDHWLAQPHARVLAYADDSFPADLHRTGVRQLHALNQLLDAIPAAEAIDRGEALTRG